MSATEDRLVRKERTLDVGVPTAHEHSSQQPPTPPPSRWSSWAPGAGSELCLVAVVADVIPRVRVRPGGVGSSATYHKHTIVPSSIEINSLKTGSAVAGLWDAAPSAASAHAR